MNRSEIMDAWVFLRKKNHSISDEALDFIKESSLKAFDSWDKTQCQHEPVVNKAPDSSGIVICRRCGLNIKWVESGQYLAVISQS